LLEFGRPAAWDEVARTFPSLPIVIGEFGFPWIDETMVLLGKHARVYAEVSGVVSRPWQLFNALLSAASLGVMDRLLFGSGFPFEAPAKAIEQLYSVNTIAIGTQLPSVSRAAVRAIVERDALRILGIEHEPAIDTSAALEDRFAAGTRMPRIGSQIGS
jgi:predicted TIM-barrel fold metal-dependent hydrolase